MNSSTQAQEINTEDHVDWVRAMTSKFMSRFSIQSSHTEELVGIGLLGLVEAADRYSAEKGVAFRAYAQIRVRGALLDGLSQLTGVSKGAYKRIKVYRALTESQSEEEIARVKEVSGESKLANVFEFAAQAALAYRVQYMSEEGEELLSSEKSTPEELAQKNEVVALLKDKMKELPEREKKVLEKYYFQFATFDEIGEAEGMSKGYVSKVHKKALEKLYKALSLSL